MCCVFVFLFVIHTYYFISLWLLILVNDCQAIVLAILKCCEVKAASEHVKNPLKEDRRLNIWA